MSEKFAPPRGTQDLLPPVSDAIEALAAAASRRARLFGFHRIETPTFEHTELFARGVGESTDIVAKEMYTFDDKGGRSLTLRPEGTAPVVRAYLGNRQSLGSPFKAFYVVPMFRHERPQAGRMRQHTQFGVEVIGTDAPGADVEVIGVAHAFLSGLGVRLELKLNSIGDPACRPAYRDALIAFLEERADRLPKESRERIHQNPLRVLDAKDDASREATVDAPSILEFLCAECREHLASVRSGLDDEGIAYEVDPRLVRGLDYYTRTTFEFVSPSLGPTQSTLCGGGRYDGLAETLGGDHTPGIGFGLGLERALLAIEREGLEAPRPQATEVFVVALGTDAQQEGRAFVRTLREAGVPTEMTLEDRPMKAQLKQADRSGARFTAIIGEQELASGEATMRRMADGEQERVKRSEVVSWLSR